MHHNFLFLERGEEAVKIEVDVIVEPVVNYDVPFAIVRTKFD